jgi:hypothetical protein
MYVDKTLALSYLAGSEIIFNKLKTSFLESYKNFNQDILLFYNSKNFNDLYRYIHNIKGISLNLGSKPLYDNSILVLEEFKKDVYNLSSINKLLDTLVNVYNELKSL